MQNGILHVLAQICLLAVIVWIATIFMAHPDRKPVVACAPLYYTAGTGSKVVSSAAQTASTNPSPDTAGFAQKATLACLRFVDTLVRS